MIKKEILMIPELLVLDYAAMCLRQFQPVLLNLIRMTRFVYAQVVQGEIKAFSSPIK